MQAFVSIMHYDLKKKIFIFSSPGCCLSYYHHAECNRSIMFSRKKLRFSKPRVLSELFSLFHYKSIIDHYALRILIIMNSRWGNMVVWWVHYRFWLFFIMGFIFDRVLPYLSYVMQNASFCTIMHYDFKKKIFIFPSPGCCHSCCSHNAKWAKKSFFFQS